MFAVSQSECPTDDTGRPCGGKGECVVPDEEEELPKCVCPFGTAVSSSFPYFS